MAWPKKNIVFAVSTCIIVLVAHDIAYLTHEYSHSFVAWALGWMANPLAIDYGHPTLFNVLFLQEVSDNVQYSPIFASGHGLQATLIALSGPFIGNGIVYGFLYRLTKTRAVAANRGAMTMIYWTALMCAGNVWGYVPIRAIATHADIAIAAQGLHISTWSLFLFLIVPALFVVYHFYCVMFPRCLGEISSGSVVNKALIIALTSYWFFAVFGGDGADGSYGIVTQLMAIGSKCFLFPVAVVWLTAQYVLVTPARVGAGRA